MDARVNYLLLATALLGTFFSGTATRIFNISMPTVASSLGTDLIGISWALLAYQLSKGQRSRCQAFNYLICAQPGGGSEARVLATRAFLFLAVAWQE